MPTEDKWKANMQKVAFAQQFPGLLLSWQACDGKTIRAVLPLTGKAGAMVIVFTDASFTIVPPLAPEPWAIGQALTDARAHLESAHRTAYEEYDQLAQKDREALRTARLEKILGAIHNNLEQIPELKDRLKELVKEWQ
jgi:hypothetical protein